MRKITFRNVPFLDREYEENYILTRLNDKPANILFIYGPKSSGKTTFIEYIVEEKLQKDKKFYVNYVNFRGYAIANYSSFLNIYFKPIYEKDKKKLTKIWERFIAHLGVVRGEVSIPEQGINFGISIDLYEQLNRNEADPFDLLFEILKKINNKGKTPVLIIDEVQELTDIYMNGEVKNRYLLTEFFKFLIRLTKETHLAHIIVMTSSSVFIDEIYNNSKLAQTSEFYLFDHFDYNITREWLKMENFNNEDIKLIWEYFGGCPFNIITLISNRKIMGDKFNLKNYLIEQAEIISGKIDLTVSREFEKDEEADYFLKILEEMIKNGYAVKKRDKMLEKVLRVGIEKDILFLIPSRKKIIFNSHIMKKGAEIYLQC